MFKDKLSFKILLAFIIAISLLNIAMIFSSRLSATNPPDEYSWTLDWSQGKWHCENGWYEHCWPKSAYSW